LLLKIKYNITVIITRSCCHNFKTLWIYLSTKFEFFIYLWDTIDVLLFSVREKTGWQRGQHVALKS